MVNVLALNDSFLEKWLIANGKQHQTFGLSDKHAVVDTIDATTFDILVSAGCPFILPIFKLSRSGRLFINSHPSYLPHLKGKHPVNGALLKGARFHGSTTHYMNDGVDTGNIINQDKFNITSDIDLGLIYKMVFSLEKVVFMGAIDRLKANDFKYAGTPQTGKGSYYTRSDSDCVVDFSIMLTQDIMRRIRAFGTKSIGVKAVINGIAHTIFDAEAIHNRFLLDSYKDASAGKVLFHYEDVNEKFLVRTRDGIIKVKLYSLDEH